jgi:hypothetical protein
MERRPSHKQGAPRRHLLVEKLTLFIPISVEMGILFWAQLHLLI